MVPAQLVERVRADDERLGRIRADLAAGLGYWRAFLARHRTAATVLGSAAGGAAIATFGWRALLRLGARIAGAALRAATFSAMVRSQVRRTLRAR